MSVKVRRQQGAEEQIGDVKHSILTQTQFQSLHGSTWVLMQGQSIAGSDLAVEFGVTTLPDARGVVIRGKNNGRSDGNQNPDGDVALGTFQDHAFQGHWHQQYYQAGQLVGSGPYNQRSINSTLDTIDGLNPNRDAINGNHGAVNVSTETRMRNITLNTFIKINR